MMNAYEIYRIHESKTGAVLIWAIELPSDRVENVSGDSAEGHFLSSQMEELGERW
jgi:hypothetical protein